MKFLVILVLFLASQAVLAKGLSQRTQRVLEEGSLFDFKWLLNGALHRVESVALREINSSPEFFEEAFRIVEANHEPNKSIYLKNLLEIERKTHSLGLDFTVETIALSVLITNGELTPFLSEIRENPACRGDLQILGKLDELLDCLKGIDHMLRYNKIWVGNSRFSR